jgi:hypothetical protein
MDERVRFCPELGRGDLSMAELCGSFGISRTTDYKQLDRFEF